MPIDGRIQYNPTYDPVNNPSLRQPFVNQGNPIQPDIISNNPNMPNGQRIRQLIRWKVPGLGMVDMYINPQQMATTEKKIITRQRTKNGYIIQYWGEELTNIRLSGTTGAGGIEGINILRKVYRAEQDSFQKVAQQMSDRVQSYSAGGSIAGLIGNGGSSLGQKLGGAITGMLGGSASPPLLPTLGSLALSVEMFYQGWVFKGFFEEFTIDESVSNGIGIFNYTMTFIVVDRRGIRSNFMPFHRSPAITDPATGNPINFYSSNYNSTPLSFNNEE